MPTSANKDIVESKYSKYGENNMITEGFVTDHEHNTDSTTSQPNESHLHTIPVSSKNTDGTKHEEYMDCYPIDEKGEEVMEIKSKPIPEFMKRETIGDYIFIVFWIVLFLISLWFIINYCFTKKDAGNSS